MESPMNNRTKILAALEFLILIAVALSSELKALISGNEIRLSRHTSFVRKDATGAASTWNLIDENTKSIAGVSSVSERRFPKNQALIFDKVAVGFAEGDADGKEGALDYTSAKAPAILRNASLVLTQNGREVLDIPIADLTKTISPGSPEDYYHDLESFSYFADDQAMEWQIKFPNGESFAPSAAGKFNYVEVRLQGYKTSRKVA